MKNIKTIAIIAFFFLSSCTEANFIGKWKCYDYSYYTDEERIENVIKDEELKGIIEDSSSEIAKSGELFKSFEIEFFGRGRAIVSEPKTPEPYEIQYEIINTEKLKIGSVIYDYKWIDKNHFNYTQTLLDGMISITLKMERNQLN